MKIKHTFTKINIAERLPVKIEPTRKFPDLYLNSVIYLMWCQGDFLRVAPVRGHEAGVRIFALDHPLMLVETGKMVVQHRLEVLTGYRANQDTRPCRGNETIQQYKVAPCVGKQQIERK